MATPESVSLSGPPRRIDRRAASRIFSAVGLVVVPWESTLRVYRWRVRWKVIGLHEPQNSQLQSVAFRVTMRHARAAVSAETGDRPGKAGRGGNSSEDAAARSRA